MRQLFSDDLRPGARMVVEPERGQPRALAQPRDPAPSIDGGDQAASCQKLSETALSEGSFQQE
jgi:hypothetical protein